MDNNADTKLDDFNHIIKAIAHLEAKLTIYRNTYNSEETIEIMNKIDGEFFGEFGNAYLDSIILCISRLMDRPKTSSFKNLSIPMIHENYTNNCSDDDKVKLENLLLSLKNEYEPIKKYRDKFISHSDYKTIIIDKAQPLIKIDQMLSMISLMKEYIQAWELSLFHDYAILLPYDGNGGKKINNLLYSHQNSTN